MSRIKFGHYYFSEKEPVRVEKIVDCYSVVRSGAGTKGKIIGAINTNVHVIIDTNEDEGDWVRIYSVEKMHPVPAKWLAIWQAENDYEPCWEWWIEKKSLADVLTTNSVLRYIVEVDTKTGNLTWSPLYR